MSGTLAFETIGNATLIVYDQVPVLATDPWLVGPAYFGSWTLSHDIPAEQLDAIKACSYVWISHGHPDHLSMPSLQLLKDKEILLPDHVGGRIRSALVADGFTVRVLTDRTWMRLSERVEVMCIADYNQDAILIVRMGKVIVVDANDASERWWGSTVRRITRGADHSFLLALSGYGDADMINYFDAAGERIPPPAARRDPPGVAIRRRMDRLGVDSFIPFASMHRYQRSDSVWANEYTTPVSDHSRGFVADGKQVLPAFVRYECLGDRITALDPQAAAESVHAPEEFGDDWSEGLRDGDRDALDRYFGRMTALNGVLDEIEFRVGGDRHVVHIGTGTQRGVVFEVPRASLAAAVQYEIFDDLLIGNYMKTTLRGDWPGRSLNPTFTAVVGKYADNGQARTPAEIRAYLAEYRRRAPLEAMRAQARDRYRTAMSRTAARARRLVPEDSRLYRLGSSAYRRLKR